MYLEIHCQKIVDQLQNVIYMVLLHSPVACSTCTTSGSFCRTRPTRAFYFSVSHASLHAGDKLVVVGRMNGALLNEGGLLKFAKLEASQRERASHHRDSRSDHQNSQAPEYVKAAFMNAVGPPPIPLHLCCRGAEVMLIHRSYVDQPNGTRLRLH